MPSQRWGIGRLRLSGWRVHFKGGWGSGTGRIDHQVALLTRDVERLSVAVLTVDRVARLRLVNHPITGPIFSGPHQTPFVCKTNQSRPPLGDSLGEPLVDNQAGDGFRVLAPDGSTAGYSRDCSARTVVDRLYRTTANTWKALPAGPRPPTWPRRSRSTAAPSTSWSAASAARSTAVGGSGGAIQQYVYGQHHRGLLDAAIPNVSYPDATRTRASPAATSASTAGAASRRWR